MSTPETTPVELKPCPFCGGAKFQQNTKAKGYFVKKAAERAGKDTSNHIIRCTKCGAKGPLKHSQDDAIAAWNTHPPLANRPTERALVEAARAVERHLLTEMPGMWGNAPGHGHKVVGIWDRDPGNGDKGGTACEWCAQWDAFRAALKAHGETVG